MKFLYRLVDPHEALAKRERLLLLGALALLVVFAVGAVAACVHFYFGQAQMLALACGAVAAVLVLHVNQLVSGRAHYWGRPLPSEWAAIGVIGLVLAVSFTGHRSGLKAEDIYVVSCIVYAIAAEALGVSSLAKLARERYQAGLPLVDLSSAPKSKYLLVAWFETLIDPCLSMPQPLRGWVMLMPFECLALGLGSQLQLSSVQPSFFLFGDLWFCGGMIVMSAYQYQLSLQPQLNPKMPLNETMRAFAIGVVACILPAIAVAVVTKSFDWTLRASFICMTFMYVFGARFRSRRIAAGRLNFPPAAHAVR